VYLRNDFQSSHYLKHGQRTKRTRKGFEFAFPQQKSGENSMLGLIIFTEENLCSREYSGTFWDGVNVTSSEY
jgi:hypothetical protein